MPSPPPKEWLNCSHCDKPISDEDEDAFYYELYDEWFCLSCYMCIEDDH